MKLGKKNKLNKTAPVEEAEELNSTAGLNEEIKEPENIQPDKTEEVREERVELAEIPEVDASADLNGDGVIDEDEAEINSALKSLENRTIEPPKKKKFGWLGYVFLLAMIAVGIWLIFKIVNDMDGDAKGFGEALAGGSWQFALIALAILLTILACDWMKYSIIMKTTTGRFNLRSSMKVAFLGKFYDNVTPFAVGGQPMQIYYLHKKGFSGGISSAVVLIKYFAQMFAYTMVSLILMACNTGVLSMIEAPWDTIIMVGAWIGLVVNMFLPFMIILFVVLPKLARALTSFVVGLGAKIKIVKDKDATLGKAEKVVSDFRSGFAIMSKRPVHLIALLLCCVIDVFLTFAFPYFVMRSYNALPTDGGYKIFFIIMALNVFSTQAVAVIPTPGNSGAIEGVVAKAFLSIAITASLSWAIFTWRFAVYYIYIIIGLGLLIFEFIRKIYRNNKKKRLLRKEESNE